MHKLRSTKPITFFVFHGKSLVFISSYNGVYKLPIELTVCHDCHDGRVRVCILGHCGTVELPVKDGLRSVHHLQPHRDLGGERWRACRGRARGI